jgi:hypothetical protein
MVKAREEGLIAGIGLSGVTREHLLYTVGQTDIVCVHEENLAVSGIELDQQAQDELAAAA